MFEPAQENALEKNHPGSSSSNPEEVREGEPYDLEEIDKVSSLSSQNEKTQNLNNRNSNDQTNSDLLSSEKFPAKNEEIEETSFNPSNLRLLHSSTSDEGVSENGEIKRRLSVICEHPEKTGTAALAHRCEFNLEDPEALETLLKENDAFAGALWKGDSPSTENFEEASCAVVDWDMPGHKQSEMPNEFRKGVDAIRFIEQLLPPQVPRPNLAYVTTHGIRMIWVTLEPIVDKETYRTLLTRLASDCGGDMAATAISSIFRCRLPISENGLVILHKNFLDYDEYLSTSPHWSRLNTLADAYESALEKLSLKMGSQSSLRCPLGGHDSDDRAGIRVYPNGVMCFSNHGFIHSSRIIEIAGMPAPSGSLADFAYSEVSRFAPKRELLEILEIKVEKVPGVNTQDRKIFAKILFDFAVRLLTKKDQQWFFRLEHIFRHQYPYSPREYAHGKFLLHETHRESGGIDEPPTFLVRRFETRDIPRSGIEAPLLRSIAPKLHFINFSKEGAVKYSPTANISRFVNGEATAMLSSSLFGICIYNRPAIGVKVGWVFQEGSLPCCVYVPSPLHKGNVNSNIIQELVVDLKANFSFEDPDIMAPQYLGFLIQGMLAHLSPGQNPLYFFKGPTHAGKGYLGNVFPGFLYATQFGSGVCEANFKEGSYELSILMAKAVQFPYVFFDEIIHAGTKELKFIDNLATQKIIQYRGLYKGYLGAPNHLTVALTAINKEFSDETKARLVEISLTRSTPSLIKAFHEKWKNRLSELFASFFQALSNVNFKEIPSVENRRTGFGVIKKALENGLHVTVDYPLHQSSNDILDVIARMYDSNTGRACGKWKRYTPKNVLDAFNFENKIPIRNSQIAALLNTALGYQSTEEHPVFGRDGYPSEDGRRFHIKIRDEGQGTGAARRKYIYVRETETCETNQKSSPEAKVVPTKNRVSTTTTRKSQNRASSFPIVETRYEP